MSVGQCGNSTASSWAIDQVGRTMRADYQAMLCDGLARQARVGPSSAVLRNHEWRAYWKLKPHPPLRPLLDAECADRAGPRPRPSVSPPRGGFLPPTPSPFQHACVDFSHIKDDGGGDIRTEDGGAALPRPQRIHPPFPTWGAPGMAASVSWGRGQGVGIHGTVTPELEGSWVERRSEGIAPKNECTPLPQIT